MSGSEPSSKPSSLILGNCLNCQGLVRVPSFAAPNTEVRCPHCGETFALVRILEQSVPELEVVGDQPALPLEQTNNVSVETKPAESDDSEIDDREKFVVPIQLSEGARRKRRRSKSNSAAMQPVRKEAYQENVARLESAPRVKRRRSSSRSQGSTSKNSPAEFIKIALGAMLAFPIAYLIVLWGFRQDPLNVGPSVGSVIPAIIPADLRGLSAEDEIVDIDDSDDGAEPGEAEPDDAGLAVPTSLDNFDDE